MEFYTDKLKVIRTLQKLSAEKLASKMGINRTTYCSWEYGKRSPSEAKIRLLAKALNVSVDEISDLIPEAPVSTVQFSDAAQSWISLSSTGKEKQHKKIKFLISGINSLYKELSDTKLFTDALMTSIGSIFYIKDINLNYVTANIAFLENLSLNKNYSVLKKNDFDLFSQKEAVLNYEQDKQVLLSGKSIINQEGYIPGSRKKKWGLISKIPVFDDENKIEGLVGSFIDITDRVKEEKQRKLLERVINNAEDIFWIAQYDELKNDFKYLFINSALKKLYGFNAVELEKFREHEEKHPLSKAENNYLITQPIEKFPLIIEGTIVRTDKTKRIVNRRIFKLPEDNIYFGMTRDITDQKKTEEEKEILYKLLSKSKDIINLFDLDEQKYIFISESIEKLTGYPADTFYNDPNAFFELYSDNQYKTMWKKYRKEQNWPSNSIYKLIRKNGEQRWCEEQISTYTLSDRKFTFSIVRDITDQKKTEEEKEILYKLLSKSKDIISLFDIDKQKYIFISESIEELTGYSTDTFYNDPNAFFELCLDDQYKTVRKKYRKEQKWPSNSIYKLIRKNGEQRWCEEQISTYTLSDRKFAFSIVRDITEQKKNEEHKEILHKLLSKSDDIISIYDINKEKIIYINDVIEKFTGYSADIICNDLNVFYDNCLTPSDKKIRKTFAKNKNWPEITKYKLIHKDGTSRLMESRINRDNILGRNCSISISRDITKKIEYEQKIEYLEMTLNSMSACLSLRDLETNKYLYTNKAAEKIWGYPGSSDEFIKGNDHDFWLDNLVHEEDKKKITKYMKTGKWPEKFEYLYKKPNGDLSWIESISTTKQFLDRNCVASISRDITKKKEQEQQRILLEKTINDMTDAFSLRDLASNKYIYLNPAIEKIFGCPIKNFTDNKSAFWTDNIVHDETRKIIKEKFQTGNLPDKFEYLYKRPDGSLIWIETTTSTINYYDKSCILSINRDITIRKHNEEIHRLLDLHHEATSTAVVIRNNDKVIYANQGLADLYGYPLKKLIDGYFDFRIKTCIHPDDKKEEEMHIREGYANITEWPLIKEQKIIRPSGEIRVLQITVIPLEFFGEKCFATIIKDITEDKKLKEELSNIKNKYFSKSQLVNSMKQKGLDQKLIDDIINSMNPKNN